MQRRLLTTIATTAWLTGLYLLYARFVSPLVEPAQLTANPNQTVQPIVAPQREYVDSEHHSVAQSFLPGQEWAKNADNQYRIGDLFLYAMEVEQLNEQAEIRFRPFAMVWKNPNGRPDEPPLRITAEAAVIRFQAAFDVDNPQPGRPVFGALEGAVEIQGPNGLKIVGHGFTFSEEALKLWSDSDVLFHYGPQRATGRGLQVDFLPATETAATADMPRLAGIHSIALLRQVVLDLKTEASTNAIAGPSKKPRAPDQLHVTSDGRLQFDLESNLLTIEQNVRVTHPIPGAAKEGMNCDLVTLVLSSEASRSKAGLGASPQQIELTSNETMESVDAAASPQALQNPAGSDAPFTSWLPEHLELEKLLADGSGKRRVAFFSPERDLHGNTTQIEYDLRQRAVFLRDPATVDVVLAESELHAPDLTVIFAENHKDVTYAVARGAGNAISQLKDGRTVTANWKKQLIKSIDPRTGWDLVELQGQASMGLESEYQLAGDALRVWASQSPDNPKVGQDGTNDDVAIPQIERVAGVGKVSLKSPQATSENDWLDIKFQSAELPPPTSDDSESLFGLKVSGDSPAGQRGSRNSRLAKKPRPPIQLKSQRLSATILRDVHTAERMLFSEMTAEGAIEIAQQLSVDSTQPPVQMLGEKLVIQRLSATQQLVDLSGSPASSEKRMVSAEIRSGAARIVGPLIALNTELNKLDVTGAGWLEYPVKTSLEGQKLDRPQVLHVQWAESLSFNGKTADFYEKVEASMDQTAMRCNAMHVTLVDPIQFDDPELKSLKSKDVQLARIFCENRVELVTCEHRQNVVVSRGSGRLGQFVIDNVSGKTEALGPGYFVRWTLGQPKRETKTASNRPAKKITPRAAIGWTYSRIDFQGHMKGNIRERTATFEDHVEMVYGPVPHATDLIDPDSLPEGGAAMTCDSLKVSQFAESETDTAHLRFSAERNTKLDLLWEGRPFFMMADEVKYDESKDVYLARANGDRKVVIRMEPTADNLDANTRCARVYLCPSLSIFRIDQATKIGVQQ